MFRFAHKNIGYKLSLLVFLCATILSVQLATLNHSTEHQFHKHQELCDSFLVYEHNATALSFFAIRLSIEIKQEKTIFEVSHSQLQPIVFRSIRAPPALAPIV